MHLTHTFCRWEGGTRVPSFVFAPGRLKAGQVVNSLVHVSDWMPTLLAAAGGAAPSGINGMNVWPTLIADTPVRNEVPVNINPLCKAGLFGVPKAALRFGDMKIVCYWYTIAGIDNATETACLPNPKEHPGAWPKLFNLTADPSETTNLAPTRPDVVEALLSRLAEIAAQSVEPMQWDPPYQGPEYACASCPKHPTPYPADPARPWTAWL
jgi:arylsulfatase A-like enzyme